MPYILKAGQVESKDNKTNVLSNKSTHDQYPSAKAVYDAISGINGEDLKDLDNRVDTVEKDINTNKNSISNINKKIIDTTTSINKLTATTSNLEAELEKVPIKYVESPDADGNILSLRYLSTGTYVLNGTFKPFEASDERLPVEGPFFANVTRGSKSSQKNEHHTNVQLYNPTNNAMRYYNIVQHLPENKITYEVKTIFFSDLTTEQKVEEMIDAKVVAQGGANILMVTWDGVEGSQSSHLGEQIYDHIQDGGTAALHNTESDEYFPLTWCGTDRALFGYFSAEDGIGFGFEVGESGDVWGYQYDTIGTYHNITIPQNWSIKEKQTARENIGAMSEEDVNNKISSLNGGAGLMLVQWDGADDLSHSYEEMIEHLLAGGNVILCEGGYCYYSLDHMVDGELFFKYTGDDYVDYLIGITSDNSIEQYELSSIPYETFYGEIARLDGRIDYINTSGGSITVDAKLSHDSTNPVQNKVVANEISQIGQTATYARNQLEKDVVPRLEQVESSIGNIQSVLDTIIATQENIIGKITFTVGGNSYEAVNGMTWGEWVNTRYNIDGFNSVTGGWIVTHENFFVTDPSYNNVTVDSVIKNNYKYMLD